MDRSSMFEPLDQEPVDPLINCIQRLAVYETKSVDRTEAKDLVIVDDKHLYSRQDIESMIAKIQQENRKGSGGIRKASGHAILGFFRLLEGYYLVLITKRRRVAQIGHHVVYKIDETSTIYIPAGEAKLSAEEKRYLRIWHNVDLSSNFYFSYSYDLTRTLQYNLSASLDVEIEMSETPWSSKINFTNLDESTLNRRRHKPNLKFAWNTFLLKDWDLHPEWKLYVIHGFVSQANISVYGLPIFLTLISRRSAKYAGTRFLKRGANFDGDVANEVETEQIVHDSSVSSLKSGRFTSFVQMRGSVPSHWSQDVSKMVPKPLITLDIADPYHKTAGLHFNQLFARYGSPIIILNLVKCKERRPHETVLSNEYISAIQYLNQFLPPQFRLIHEPYDMAHVNKTKDSNVMGKLSDIAFDCIRKTGVFRSWPTTINPTEGGIRFPSGRQFQTGVVRVNCVDCLDRTNTAAFALGKAALGLQLHALGLLLHPELEFDTDAIRMLEELYEDQGDTIALQYGGSQLVHRIKTYRKIAPLSSHSRDIMQTMSRYYSNTFSDSDKQNAINLFLGVYVPHNKPKFMPDIWELQTDFYLHNPIAGAADRMRNRLEKPLTCWWDETVVSCLPLPANQVLKGRPENFILADPNEISGENTDGFYDQYRPYDLKTLHETLSFQMLHTSKDFAPTSATDFSPFKVRGRLNKRKESVASHGFKLFGSLMSFAPSLTASSPSLSDADSDEDDSELPLSRSNSIAVECDSLAPPINEMTQMSATPRRTYDYLLTRPEEVYGQLMKPLSDADEKLYARYCRFGEFASGSDLSGPRPETPFEQKCNDVESELWKPLSTADRKMFEEYVRKKDVRAAIVPTPSDYDLYYKYAESADHNK